MKQGLLMFVGIFMSSLALSAVAERGDQQSSVAELFEPYGLLLERYLVERDLDGGGLVSAFRYDAADQDPRAEELLREQRERLAAFDPEQLTEKYQAIAFWLNAYNFFMIAHILEEQPGGELVDSVWDYGGRYNPLRANVFERDLFDIGGRKYSLDEIEKEILLGEDYRDRGWKEARVHFAVNCASVGCPPLRLEPYTTDNVDELMTENTRRALKTERHMHIDDDTLRLSQVFQWYEQDYIEEAGSLRDFVKAYTDDERHEAIDGARRIRYIDYNWALNSPENFPELD